MTVYHECDTPECEFCIQIDDNGVNGCTQKELRLSGGKCLIFRDKEQAPINMFMDIERPEVSE